MKGILTTGIVATALLVGPATSEAQGVPSPRDRCVEQLVAAAEASEIVLSEETRKLCGEVLGGEFELERLLLVLAGRLLEGGEDQRAADLLHLAANLGNLEAKVLLGRLYINGRGVPSDNLEARRWLQVPAEDGNAEAQLLLGALYLGREGIAADANEAIRWLTMAAEQGYPDAQTYLGTLYLQGRYLAPGEVISKHYEKAQHLLSLAADAGDSAAQVNLASMYRRGLGVERDNQIALSWLWKAAAQGEPYAEEYLGDMYAKGEGVEPNTEMALNWYRRAAQQGHPGAAEKVRRLMSAN